MRKNVFPIVIILLLLLNGFSLKSFAQRHIELPLWPEKEGIEDYNEALLKVYLPDEGNGMAVITCPGGSYTYLALEKEGSDFASFYNEQGIALIVLKYRMPNGRANVPLEDAIKAMRMVNEKLAEWHINKNKIGIMGASAGGHLASTLATHFGNDTRPAFQILLYPVISMKKEITHKGSQTCLLGDNPANELIEYYSNELQVTDQTPPAFIVLSHDDGVVSSLNSVYYYTALKNNNIYSELHIYPTGGHGWALLDSFAYKREWSTALKKWLTSVTKMLK